ncbi:MAG: glycosyltransferase 87 family protein [Allosphingosinicella sp.]
MWKRVTEGRWLTPDRIRAVAWVSGCATLLALLYLLATASGTLDRWGRPLGTDFSNVWTAGRMALDGRAAEAWSWSAHHQVQRETHGAAAVPFYGWHYPPPFLLVAALLGLLPYLAALLAWQGATLAAAAAVVRSILPGRPVLLPVLGAPVVFVCIAHGHNGFLTAALLGGGLLLLDRRPVLAGLLLGGLVYKPQLALLIPPLLLVLGNWRAFAAAAASAGILIGITLLAWGWPVWQAFIDTLPLTREIVVEAGATGWHKIQSPFGMAMMWGAALPFAYALQALATVTAIGLTLWLARTADPALRNAAATAAALLSTPYVMDYDFVVLGIGVAFLVADGLRRGFLDWEKPLLGFVWAAPFFARQLGELAGLPVGQAAAVVVLLLAARRALRLDQAVPSALLPLSRR